MRIPLPFARAFKAKQQVSLDFDLVPDRVREALQVKSAPLVAEVFEFAKLTAAEEVARQGRIDMKANLLLGAIGVSISVATILMPKAETWFARISLGAAAVLAFCAGCCAVFGLRVLTYYRIGDRTIFNSQLLEQADRASDGGGAVAMYQRYMIPAMWDAHVTYVRTNDKRAIIVAWGQMLFLGALAAAIVGGIALVVRP